MFCPLRKEFRFYAAFAVLALLSALVSTAAAESVSPESPATRSAFQAVRSSVLHPREIALRSPVAAPALGEREVIVLEAPRVISFDRLRREAARYPDSGMAGRFVELSMECPPLFGSDQE